MRHSSNFDIVEVKQPSIGLPQPVSTYNKETPAYDVIPPVGSVNGLRMLKACRYNYELMAVAIYARKNYKEILDSIINTELIANVSFVVKQLREGAGLPVDDL
jgi:hypothetical protein